MEAPIPITKILIQTRQRVEGRGHDLGPFRHGPAGATAVCLRCGGGVTVRADGTALVTGSLNHACHTPVKETSQ